MEMNDLLLVIAALFPVYIPCFPLNRRVEQILVLWRRDNSLLLLRIELQTSTFLAVAL
jgi:hypothetical protein